MRDESKEKTFEFPMMPIYGVDLGRELGGLAAGQRQIEARMDKLEAKIDAVDAKIDSVDAKFEVKTDKMAYTLHRLDERVRHLSMVTWGGLVVLLIAIVVQ